MTRCIPDGDTIPLPKGLAALTSKGYNLAPHTRRRAGAEIIAARWGPATARDRLTTPRILGENHGSIQ